MSVVKKLASDTALYGLSSIVGRFLNWLLVAVHTRVFHQPKLLADNNQLYIYVILLNIIYTYGMETAFFRYANKKENRQEYYNLILSYIILTSIIFSVIIFFCATPLINWMGFPGKERLIVWFAIILATDAIAAIAFVKLRAEGRSKRFVFIRMTNIFINIGLNAFYLMFCKYIHEGLFLQSWKPFADFFYNPAIGPDYIVWANFIASLLTILLLWREFLDFRFNFNFEKFKPIFVYAYPLLIMGLAGAINQTADRVMFREILPEGFYQGLSTDDAFSIYANVYKLSIFMLLVVQAYRYAADPFFFSKAEDKNSPAMIALATKWFTISCILIWVGVSVNIDLISLILGKTYRSGIIVVPILLLANLFIGVYQNTAIWFKLSDKTQYGTYFTIAGMVLTIILNIILIPRMGYVGCAITFAISSFVMMVLCYYYGQKHYPIPYELKSVSTYLIIAAILIYVSMQVKIENTILSISLRILLSLLFLVGIVFLERTSLGLRFGKSKKKSLE
ncbi:polysaccharide biosynthesis protein [Emticicia oligotrophica DSM 17448]|uniref:Polysaccharide biosynthesis protein n=1 Tax=Emticicia oligotrophica (strain DSM 17448 / CIP 109782 / MTCC 6937 / GPTSA100-15) TaxID=929562 RepID=A0ABM5N0C1_EMTOG|nr:polysaccharide biosynthesis C-terminal domain-containing protein [Emticicia oligotrophica]AFK02776.1 polysaccharide biosynthesis protein [Emticicia oligotrophica DSM 17448]